MPKTRHWLCFYSSINYKVLHMLILSPGNYIYGILYCSHSNGIGLRLHFLYVVYPNIPDTPALHHLSFYILRFYQQKITRNRANQILFFLPAEYCNQSYICLFLMNSFNQRCSGRTGKKHENDNRSYDRSFKRIGI